MEAYNDNEQSWVQKATPTVAAPYVQVRGWNIEGKGMIGGGAYEYQNDADIDAGYETLYFCPSGAWYWTLQDALNACGTDYYAERVQVHWNYFHGGILGTGQTHLYDNLTESWTTMEKSPYGARGNQATSSANSETVALAFSLGTSYANDWMEYKLSTNIWKNKGDFGLTITNDIGEEVTFIRWNSAGAEI